MVQVKADGSGGAMGYISTTELSGASVPSALSELLPGNEVGHLLSTSASADPGSSALTAIYQVGNGTDAIVAAAKHFGRRGFEALQAIDHELAQGRFMAFEDTRVDLATASADGLQVLVINIVELQ